MLLTKQQAAAVLATLRISPVEEGGAVRVAYNFPDGRIVSVVRRDTGSMQVRVNEYTLDVTRDEAYTSVETFAHAYGLALP